jgi:hypothetical protein
MNNKTMLFALLTVMGMVSAVNATGYAENNTVTNVLYATYDLITAVIEQMIPFIPTFIGVGILFFVIGALTVVIASILGLVTILTKFGRKR